MVVVVLGILSIMLHVAYGEASKEDLAEFVEKCPALKNEIYKQLETKSISKNDLSKYRDACSNLKNINSQKNALEDVK